MCKLEKLMTRREKTPPHHFTFRFPHHLKTPHVWGDVFFSPVDTPQVQKTSDDSCAGLKVATDPRLMCELHKHLLEIFRNESPKKLILKRSEERFWLRAVFLLKSFKKSICRDILPKWLKISLCFALCGE